MYRRPAHLLSLFTVWLLTACSQAQAVQTCGLHSKINKLSIDTIQPGHSANYNIANVNSQNMKQNMPARYLCTTVH